MSYVLIQELSDKRIEQFFGHSFVYFVRSDTNIIYSWGINWYGQLGRGYMSREILKPEHNEFLSVKNITQISCYLNHSLALTSDGTVYGWGDNKKRQFSLKSEEDYILTPIVLIQIRETIKSIHCSEWESFALTLSGKVFCYTKEEYMDLEIPGEVIIDFYVDNRSYLFCQTNESLYERSGEKWLKFSYKNMFEYFCIRYQMTYKTIHFNSCEKFSIDNCFNLKSNEVKERLEIIDLNESKLTISSNVVRDLSITIKSDVKCLYKSHITPNNRLYCEENLQKINEFSVDKSLLTEGNNNYEEFQTVLENQRNGLTESFSVLKIYEKSSPFMKTNNYYLDNYKLLLETIFLIICLLFENIINEELFND